MNPSGDATDDMIRRKVDLDHVARISNQMQVPDKITLGPSAFATSQDYRGVTMEVPDRIRPGGDETVNRLDEADLLMNNKAESLDRSVFVPALQASTIEATNDEGYVAVGAPMTPEQTLSRPSNRFIPPDFLPQSSAMTEKDLGKEMKTVQTRLQTIEQHVIQQNRLHCCIHGLLLAMILCVYYTCRNP